VTFLRSSMTLFAESGECHFSEELEEICYMCQHRVYMCLHERLEDDTQELRELRWKATVDCR
jgi:hypothetical protein